MVNAESQWASKITVRAVLALVLFLALSAFFVQGAVRFAATGSLDDLTKLIQALSTAAWPALVFFVVWFYRKQVSGIIESARSRGFALEVAGQKLTMAEVTEQQQKFIEDLQKQLNEIKKKVEGFQVSPETLLTQTPISPGQANSILWVDDNPKNNSFFIDLIQKRGYRVDLAYSTAEGIGLAERNSYRLILSDMGRTENGRYKEDAGIDLLQELKKRGSEVPFIVFCSESAARRFRERVSELGGRAITADSTNLRALLDEFAPTPI